MVNSSDFVNSSNTLSVLSNVFSNIGLFLVENAASSSRDAINYNTWENIFFNRFLTIFWWLIFPSVFLFCIWVHIYFFGGKRIFLKQKWIQMLYPYNNTFHNCLGIFIVGMLILNTFKLFSYWIQIYGFKDVAEITRIWTFSTSSSGSSGDELSRFMITIHLGYIVHLLNTAVYLWYNVNKTNSFFSQENWFSILKDNVLNFLNHYVYWEIKQKWQLIFQKIKKIFG